MTTKFCIDCKHCVFGGVGQPWHDCLRDEALRLSLVTGVTNRLSCDAMRDMPICGPDGKLFEEK